MIVNSPIFDCIGTIAVALVLPVNTVAPAITGTEEVDSILSCSTGTWTATGTPSYTYKWRRDGEIIVGATANTYTLVEADEGADISCTVTITDDEGSVFILSNTVGPIAPAPPP